MRGEKTSSLFDIITFVRAELRDGTRARRNNRSCLQPEQDNNNKIVPDSMEFLILTSPRPAPDSIGFTKL